MELLPLTSSLPIPLNPLLPPCCASAGSSPLPPKKIPFFSFPISNPNPNFAQKSRSVVQRSSFMLSLMAEMELDAAAAVKPPQQWTAHDLLDGTRMSIEEIAAKLLFIRKEARPISDLKYLITNMSLFFIALCQVSIHIIWHREVDDHEFGLIIMK